MPFVLLLQHILDIRRKRDKPDMPFVLVLQPVTAHPHAKCRKHRCGRCFRACVRGEGGGEGEGGGGNCGVIFCHQILPTKCAIYFGLSVDLGVPLISSAPQETRFPTLQVPFASVWPMFRASAERLHRLLQCFLQSEHLSQRCHRCSGVAAAAAAAAAAVAVGGSAAAVVVVVVATGPCRC